MEDIKQRAKELYGEDLHADVLPAEIQTEIERATQRRVSQTSPAPWDKHATPAEPPSEDINQIFQVARPMEIVAQRQSDAGLDVNAAQAMALEQFGTLSVQTGSAMLDQWKAEYLCTFPARHFCTSFSVASVSVL